MIDFTVKLFKFFYGDSLKYIAFMTAAFFAAAFFLIFIFYPLQTVAAIVGGFVLYTLFLLITEWQ